MRAGRRRAGCRPVAVLALLVVTLLPLPLLSGAGWAAWSTSGSGPATARSAVLDPPSALGVSQGCASAGTPALRSATTASGTGSGSLSIPTPAGVVAGDLLLAAVAVRAAGPLPVPTGWELVREDGNATLTQGVYRRTAGSTEPASYDWGPFSAPAAGAVAAYAGADTAVPVDVHGGSVGTTPSTASAPSVTTTRANVRLVGLFALAHADGTPLTPDPAMVSRWGAQSSAAGVADDQVATMGADEARSASGGTGTRTSTGAGGSAGVGQLVALQPPLEPYATTTWTPSPSSFADRQLFELSSGGTLLRSADLAPGTTSRTDGQLTGGTAYTVSVRAAAGNWRSAAASAAFTALSC